MLRDKVWDGDCGNFCSITPLLALHLTKCCMKHASIDVHCIASEGLQLIYR